MRIVAPAESVKEAVTCLVLLVCYEPLPVHTLGLPDDRGAAPDPGAQQEPARRVGRPAAELAGEAQHGVQVHKHVVVRLYHELGLRAELGRPQLPHHVL